MSESAPNVADVLVIIGVTGDLAKKMTFQALYHLEADGLLDCPIISVAVGIGSLLVLNQSHADGPWSLSKVVTVTGFGKLSVANPSSDPLLLS